MPPTDPAQTTTEPAELVRLIRRGRFDLSSEKNLQAGVESLLLQAGIPFEREKRLNARDIPDFFIGGVVIECKMRGKAKKMDIYRQLERYAQLPEVTSLILASNVSMGLPEDINGKPLYAASLSQGWL